MQKYIDKLSIIEGPNALRVRHEKLNLGSDFCNLGRTDEGMEIFNEIIKTCNPEIKQEKRLMQEAKVVLAVKILDPQKRKEETYKIFK